jgi:hypothetical protein
MVSPAVVVAIYARVSTSDQSCEMQLHELRQYVARQGWEVFAEYVDTGFSGAPSSRPELDRLLQDARFVVSKLFWFGSLTAGVAVWRIASARSRSWSGWGSDS